MVSGINHRTLIVREFVEVSFKISLASMLSIEDSRHTDFGLGRVASKVAS